MINSKGLRALPCLKPMLTGNSSDNPDPTTTLPFVLSYIASTILTSDYLIIIILNFYGAYILRNLSSEAQQNRIVKHNRKQGRAKVIIRTRDNRRFMVEMQFGINICRVFFRKIAIVSNVFTLQKVILRESDDMEKYQNTYYRRMMIIPQLTCRAGVSVYLKVMVLLSMTCKKKYSCLITKSLVLWVINRVNQQVKNVCHT